jgi:hypothetical protein
MQLYERVLGDLLGSGFVAEHERNVLTTGANSRRKNAV